MELYKYCPINEFTIENLDKGKIFFNVVNRVNDPYEGIIDIEVKSGLHVDFLKFFYQDEFDMKKFEEFSFEQLKINIIFQNVNYFLEEVGISCFSESNTSMVMWGNYADSHQGICIGYDSKLGVFNYAQKVYYRNDINRIEINSRKKISYDYLAKYFEQSLYTKYTEWAYEKEWRIISDKFDECLYPETAIRAIYFGLRTSDEDIKHIYEITMKNKNIKYYRAVLKRSEFKLEYIEIQWGIL